MIEAVISPVQAYFAACFNSDSAFLNGSTSTGEIKFLLGGLRRDAQAKPNGMQDLVHCRDGRVSVFAQ